MNDKRKNRYSFSSQNDLIAFLSDTLSKTAIKKNIKTLKKTLVKSPDVSWTINRLQFLKKCEWELVRLSKKMVTESENGDV